MKVMVGGEVGQSGNGGAEVGAAKIARWRSRSKARYRRVGRLENRNRLGKLFVFTATVQVVPVGQSFDAFTAAFLKKSQQFACSNAPRRIFELNGYASRKHVRPWRTPVAAIPNRDEAGRLLVAANGFRGLIVTRIF
jgi:hypothetical protein